MIAHNPVAEYEQADTGLHDATVVASRAELLEAHDLLAEVATELRHIESRLAVEDGPVVFPSPEKGAFLDFCERLVQGEPISEARESSRITWDEVEQLIAEDTGCHVRLAEAVVANLIAG